MVAATPVAIRVNPNNSAQRLILWGNGRIVAEGGAVPVTGPNFVHRIDQQVAQDLHITNWSTSAGYVLDRSGAFHPIGGAPEIPMDPTGTWGNTLGLPYLPNEYRYVAWSWNPASVDPAGYVIDVYGEIFEFGGEPDPPRTGPRFSTPAVKGFAMQWSPSKYAITMDLHGGLHGDWGVSFGSPAAPYFAGRDVARDLFVTGWSPAKGYVLTSDGAAHAWGGAPSSLAGGPYRAGQDVARLLHVLNAEDPTRLVQVHSGGQVFEYLASDPPTVTAGGISPQSPASTVTGTTRPVLSWAYSDPQSDSQQAWELYVFTQTFVTAHSMTNPPAWEADAVVAEAGINPTTRGISSPVDLANGQYRMYVRARDTAGQWSAWSNRGWTQNVPVPPAPTGITATPDDGTFSVALSVSTSGTAEFVRFEFSDDGTTWSPVRGAEALPRLATTTGTDWDIPLGVTRTYRAVAFSVDPRTASLPSGTATAAVNDRTYVLTVVGDPALGGEVHAQEPVNWERPVSSGIFQGLGADFATVLSDGKPKGRRLTLHLLTLDRPAYEVIKAAVEADATLLFRDQFGEAMYCRLVNSWQWALLVAAPLPEEDTAVRHAHSMQLPLVEVAPPVAVV